MESTSRSSLRSLITGQPDIPPFRMLLAPGWEDHPVTAETADRLARRVSERIRHLGRPDLDAQLASDLRRSFAQIERAGSRIAYLPTAVPEGSIVPMSMVVSTIDGPNGGSLDPYVAQLFRDKGAEFFDAMKTTVRWEQESMGSDDLAGAKSRVISYVIAAPGTGRRKGALFTSTVLASVGEDLDEDLVRECVLLSDAMISTFAWVNPEVISAGGGVGTSTH